MAAMEKAAVTQKDWSEGKVVMAPVAKAHTSVSVVTVTDAPALLIVSPRVSAEPRLRLSSSGMFSRHLMMTNMSSMPIARLGGNSMRQ